MILDFLLVLARKLWLNYLIWNNPTKRGGRSSSQKLLKKKQTNKQNKNKNKNKIKQLFYHIDLLYSAKRKTIKGTESLEITCLGIHWIFKFYKNDLKKIWRCTWPKLHRKNTDKALAYSYSDIRSYEREQKCLTFSITITLYLLWFLQDGVLVWIFPSLSGGFRLCFPSSKHLNSHLHFSLRLK